MSEQELPRVLTPKEVSNFLGISLDRSYRLFKSKNFPKFKISGRLHITKPNFLSWYDNNNRGEDVIVDVKES